jgi:hypothetical protein
VLHSAAESILIANPYTNPFNPSKFSLQLAWLARMLHGAGGRMGCLASQKTPQVS